MGEVVAGSFDTFRPRKFAASKETEVVVAGDIEVLAAVENWARTRRQVTEARAEPLLPSVRAQALEMMAIAKSQPR